MYENKTKRPSLAPCNWGGWAIVSILWVLAWLPQRLGLLLVAPFGPLAFRYAHRRRAIADQNLKRCFPEWTEEKRQEVLRKSFDSVGRMIVEMSWCWSGPRSRMKKITNVHGLENLLKVTKTGRGVLLVTGHSTCVEISGYVVATEAFVQSPETYYGGIYRKLGNPVVEWYQTSRRQRYCNAMIDKNKAREIIKVLKGNSGVWYAPDQDFGADQSAFAPFFGIQTATLLATHRLPRISKCAVIPMYPIYRPDTRTYDVYILPELENFPTKDPVADLSRINAIFEEQIRKAPEQYWWVHRRFKTRPDGEPPFYP